MKKTVLCIALVLSGLTFGAYAQNPHASTANTSVTVVSDTTGTDDDTEDADGNDAYAPSIDAQIDSAMQQAFGGDDQADSDNADNVTAKNMPWMFGGKSFVISVLLIIFGLPVLLVAVILYFIYRNKKAKYEVEKAAIEKGFNPNTAYYTGATPQGQGESAWQTANTPHQADYTNTKLPNRAVLNQKLREQGIKQMCLGIGLALVLGFIVDESFSLIGILIFFIGLGKVIIARSRKTHDTSVQDYYDINRPYHTGEQIQADKEAKDKGETPEE